MNGSLSQSKGFLSTAPAIGHRCTCSGLQIYHRHGRNLLLLPMESEAIRQMQTHSLLTSLARSSQHSRYGVQKLSPIRPTTDVSICCEIIGNTQRPTKMMLSSFRRQLKNIKHTCVMCSNCSGRKGFGRLQKSLHRIPLGATTRAAH